MKLSMHPRHNAECPHSPKLKCLGSDMHTTHSRSASVRSKAAACCCGGAGACALPCASVSCVLNPPIRCSATWMARKRSSSWTPLGAGVITRTYCRNTSLSRYPPRTRSTPSREPAARQCVHFRAWARVVRQGKRLSSSVSLHDCLMLLLGITSPALLRSARPCLAKNPSEL